MLNTATLEIQEALGGANFPRLESPSLRLQKFVRLGHACKAKEVAAVVECHRKNTRSKMPRGHRPPPGATVVVAQLGGRLIVNQAGGILENASLCLHPHFGYPMIPGSAVKGLASHAAWQQWSEPSEVSERRRIALEAAVVFGYPTGHSGLDDSLAEFRPDVFMSSRSGNRTALQGGVAFLAGTPADPKHVELVADIVNCHHPAYYRNEKPSATDDEDPIPNPFPTVEAGAEFAFPLLRASSSHWVSSLSDLLPKEFNPLDRAKEWLLTGLCELGIGAKTAAGYGWFDYDEEAERKREAAEKAAREEAAKQAKEEAARQCKLAAMNPAEREALQHWESLAEADREGAFKGELANIESTEENRQRILLTLCQTEGRNVWLTEKAEYERVKDNPKKQKKSKAYKRVSKVLETAQNLGVELP